MAMQGVSAADSIRVSGIGWPVAVPVRAALAGAGVVALAAFCFLLPALWNGYPLFFYDSIDYIDSSFTWRPEIWRTLPYSLFLAGTHFGVSPWLSVIAQALLAAWLVWEFARAFAPARPLRVMAFATSLIAVGTGLPWFASQIMPDVFTGLMVIGLLLLAYARTGRLRLALIGAVTVMAVSAHASHFATAAAVWCALALLARRGRGVRPRLIAPLAAVVLGILATPVSHYAVAGEFYVSRSAPIMLLARLIRDGEAQAYLKEACPQAGYRLCPYVDELKPGWNGANDFLWGWGSPINRIEGWKHWRSFGREARTIALETVKARPVENLAAGLRAWGQQLAVFGTGSGLGRDIWNAAPLLDVLKQRFPRDFHAYTSARQYAGIELGPVSVFHRIVLAGFMLAALELAVTRRRNGLGRMLAVVILALLVNAAVAGIISNPDDRYQARLAWVLVPAVVCVLAHRRLRLPSHTVEACERR